MAKSKRHKKRAVEKEKAPKGYAPVMVTINKATGRQTIRAYQNVADKRLLEALSGPQLDAADLITVALLVRQRGLGWARMRFDDMPRGEGGDDLLGTMLVDLAIWEDECDRAGYIHRMVGWVFRDGRRYREIEAIWKHGRGWAKRRMVEALDMWWEIRR